MSLGIVKKLNFVVTANKIFGSGMKKKKEMLNLQPRTAQQCVTCSMIQRMDKIQHMKTHKKVKMSLRKRDAKYNTVT